MRPEGIFVSDFEQGEIGPDLFRAACNFGLEGLVSKRRDRPYRAGGQWIDVPDDAVVTVPNRAGRTMVWPMPPDYEAADAKSPRIRCFMPGSMI
jgi:hypothetical protein